MNNVLALIAGVACQLLSFPTPCLAQANPPYASATTTLTASTTTNNPPITGSFDDLESPSWKKALRFDSLINFTTRRSPTDMTTVYLLFGTDAIYCAFLATQSEPLSASQKENNVGLGLDDYVSVMFDTSGNGTNQYYFETTPGGLRYQAASESTRYSPVWTARGASRSHEWLGEFAIPYRFLRGSSTTWRINFARFIAKTQYTYSFAYDQKMTNAYDPTFWPILKDTPKLAITKKQATAELYALADAGSDDHVFEGAAGQFSSNTVRRLGADVKVPISSSVNFDATIGPDFSNVETDQQTISPQEFRFQYAEYRPFFTQGANYLPSSEVFYSPSVGIFDRGEKVEGQVGDFEVGLLDVGAFGSATQAYSFGYNSPDQELAISLSGAASHELGLNDDVSEVSVASLNSRSRLQVGGSFAAESGGAQNAEGLASRAYGYASISRANYSLQASFYDIGPRYAPFNAYVPQADIRGPQLSGSLSSTTAASTPIRQMSLSAYADRYVDDSGAAHEVDTGASGNVTFKDLLAISVAQNLSSLRSYRVAFPEYTGGATYPYNLTSVSASFRAGTPNTANASYAWGNYSTYFLRELNASVTRKVYGATNVELDYANVGQTPRLGAVESQTLRRITFYDSLSADASLSVAYRSISGQGGFALPGKNFAASFHQRIGKGNTLLFEYGSPASPKTLSRFIVKYIVLVGSGSGE